jgi:hypothetical protein
MVLLDAILPGLRRFEQALASCSGSFTMEDNWFDVPVLAKLALWVVRFCENPSSEPAPLNLQITAITDAANLYLTVRNLNVPGWKNMEAILTAIMENESLKHDDVWYLVDNIPHREPLIQKVIENVVRLRHQSKSRYTESGRISDLLWHDYKGLISRVMMTEKVDVPKRLCSRT